MKKRILFISVFMVLLLGCPRKHPDMNTEMCISGLNLTFIAQPADSTHYLYMEVAGELAANDDWNLNFGNTANAIVIAFQKLCRGVKEVKITSNHDFNGIKSGEDLGGKLVFLNNGVETYANMLPFALKKGDNIGEN